jgi:microcystin degradation protein MlrC
MKHINKRLRIAVGGVIHETNTFAAEHVGTTPLSAFECYEGEQIAEAFTGSNHQVGGFIDGARKHAAEVAWSFLAQATPSSTISGKAYAAMKESLIKGVRRALPVDGVLLALHGAGVAEGVEDIEGDLAAAVREVVGPGVPIAAAYDLHGNVTPQMIEACDITLPCRLYPHTDFHDRAVQCVDLLVRIIKGKLKPVTCMRQLPMLQYIVPTMPGFFPAEINEVCAKLSLLPDVEDCSWFHGFPLSDVAAPCPAVVCITNDDGAGAERCADFLANWVWERRERFKPHLASPEDGVRTGIESTRAGPLVIGDYADNPGGGTPGDGTQLLRAIIDAGLPAGECCFAVIDPAVVRQAMDAGVGATIEVSLGGKIGSRQGKPIVGRAAVASLTDGRYVGRPGSMFAGVRFDIGPMCRLVIGGVDVLVSSRAEQMYDDEPFLLHGIDVKSRRIVGIKGANHFRAGFAPIATRMITVDSGGLSSARLESFPRRALLGRVWPLHDDVVWNSASPALPDLFPT